MPNKTTSHNKKKFNALSKLDEFITPTYAARCMREPISKYTFPNGGMESQTAYQLCHDELKLDGRPGLNLASFVTTWMEPEAEKLMLECLNKNLVDQDEYPYAVKIEARCVNMIADLFHANRKSGDESNAIGTSTMGSSEAVMLCGLALKSKWKTWRKDHKQSTDKPNIVMGANVQVVWEKFARYFDIEPRYIELTEDRYILGVDEALALCDENTIGVVAILGSTFTGEYEPIAELNAALEKLNKEKDWQISIHVDAASGGFVAPFIQPKLKWDFRLSLVASINVSGHKYGLVYPGVGWAIWRDADALPEELIFHVNYLGGEMPTFNLNFSRPSAFVIGQYYNFLRLGFEGFCRILLNLTEVAKTLTETLKELEIFDILSKDDALPVVAWRLKNTDKFTVFQISEGLRKYGWIVPAYTMPKGAEDIAVLRVVVREGLSMSMLVDLLDDLQSVIHELEAVQPIGSISKGGAANKKVNKAC